MRKVFADDPRWAAAFVGLTIAAVGVVGYLAVMTGFASYDDEGYFLVSLRGYNHGAALFQEIHTQYGPFYWQFVGAIFAATGTTIDHDSGRIVTLLLWCGAAGFSAAAAWRLTRSVFLASGVAALVLHTLYLYPNEPLHPGAPISLFLAALAFVLTRPGRNGLLVAGILVAALMLMKVNVGGFALGGVLLAMAGSTPRSRLNRLWWWVLAFGFCAGPLILMLPKLGDTGFLPYGLHIALVATAFAAVAEIFPLGSNQVSGRGVHLWFLGAFAGFVVADVLLTWWTSSPLGSIWTGAIGDALSQPDLFAFAPVVSSPALVLDVVSVSLALVAVMYRGPLAEWWRGRHATLAIGGLRLAGGSLTWLAMSTMHAPLALPVTATWLAAIPSTFDVERRRWTIRAIAAVALLETLHAYPVAGSQKGWSSFMLILVAGILIGDGAREVGSVIGVQFERAVVMGIAGAAAAEALLVALVLALPSYVGTFRSFPSLDLPGARLVHADPSTVDALRSVTAALVADCGTYIPMPGMDSFYLFAREKPPTLLTSSDWMAGVDDAQQARAVREVEVTKKVCVLRNDGLVSFWLGSRPLPNRPLVAYVSAHSTNPISLPGGYSLARP